MGLCASEEAVQIKLAVKNKKPVHAVVAAVRAAAKKPDAKNSATSTVITNAASNYLDAKDCKAYCSVLLNLRKQDIKGSSVLPKNVKKGLDSQDGSLLSEQGWASRYQTTGNVKLLLYWVDPLKQNSPLLVTGFAIRPRGNNAQWMLKCRAEYQTTKYGSWSFISSYNLVGGNVSKQDIQMIFFKSPVRAFAIRLTCQQSYRWTACRAGVLVARPCNKLRKAFRYIAAYRVAKDSDAGPKESAPVVTHIVNSESDAQKIKAWREAETRILIDPSSADVIAKYTKFPSSAEKQEGGKEEQKEGEGEKANRKSKEEEKKEKEEKKDNDEKEKGEKGVAKNAEASVDCTTNEQKQKEGKQTKEVKLLRSIALANSYSVICSPPPRREGGKNDGPPVEVFRFATLDQAQSFYERRGRKAKAKENKEEEEGEGGGECGSPIALLFPCGTRVDRQIWPDDVNAGNAVVKAMMNCLTFRATSEEEKQKLIAARMQKTNEYADKMIILKTMVYDRSNKEGAEAILDAVRGEEDAVGVGNDDTQGGGGGGGEPGGLNPPAFNLRQGDNKNKKEKKAYIPNVNRLKSVAVRAHWTEIPRDSLGGVCKEYKTAYDMICLQQKWIGFTKTVAILQFIGEDFADDTKARLALSDRQNFTATIISLIKKAYRLNKDGLALRQKDFATNKVISSHLLSLFSWLNWRKPYFHYALLFWLEKGSPDSLVARLGELVDRAFRCESAKRLAFDMALRHAFRLCKKEKKEDEKTKEKKDKSDDTPKPKKTADSADGNQKTEKQKADSKSSSIIGTNETAFTFDEAKIKLYEIMAEYIDSHKLNAFRSAFQEPNKAYWNAIGPKTQIAQYEVHAKNWHLAGIMSCIGMQVPIIPYLNDWCLGGFSTFWHASGGFSMWNEFKKSENFGRSFQKIKKVASITSPSMGRTNHWKFVNNAICGSPRVFANRLANPNATWKLWRTTWALYLQRFAHFFTRDFFCSKAVSVLMQENTDNPYMLGFRESLEVIFQQYRQSKRGSIPEKTSLEYIFDADKGLYDADRVNNLFWFIGITREEVATKPRKTTTDEGEEKKAEEKPKTILTNKQEFKGPTALLTKVQAMLKEGKNQMEIFKVCRTEKLGGNKEIFDAIRFARSITA